MRILGIDPALGTTGWGLIDVAGNAMSFVAGGVVKTNAKEPHPTRLKTIHDDLHEIIETYNPTHVAIEEVFVNSNARTSLHLGQARGMCLLVPALYGLEIGEYTPLHIKKAIVGTGKAEKSQVQHMVSQILPSAGFVTMDTSDALAVAICHAHTMQFKKAVSASA